MSTNFLYDQVAVIDVMMDEVNGYSKVFDASSDCFGLEDIDARLAVLKECERADVLLVKTNKVTDTLKEDTSFRSIRGPTSLRFSRMEGDDSLLCCLLQSIVTPLMNATKLWHDRRVRKSRP